MNHLSTSRQLSKLLMLVGCTLIGFTSNSFAEVGYWRVIGSLLNIDNPGSVLGERSCLIESAGLRIFNC